MAIATSDVWRNGHGHGLLKSLGVDSPTAQCRVVRRFSSLTSGGCVHHDHSLFSRSCSKKVELLVRVDDHVSNKLVRRFPRVVHMCDLKQGWRRSNGLLESTLLL